MPVKTQRGFSLVELCIVCAIICVILAIALPQYLQARIAANEASAVVSVQAIAEAQAVYAHTWGVGYAQTLQQLGTPSGGCPNASVSQACLLDPRLTAGKKSGYWCVTNAATGAQTATNPNLNFGADCWPIMVGATGDSSFCTDENGTVYVNPEGLQIGETDTLCEALADTLPE